MSPIILVAVIGATAPTAEVLFPFDSARLPAGTSAQLEPVVTYAAAHPDVTIVVDGNTDSVGTGPYNVGLSIRRAETIESQLKLLGVDGSRLVIVAYGKDGLRRTTAALDRRVNVWTTTEPLYEIVGNALTRATSVTWDVPVQAAQIDGPPHTQTALR